MSLASPGRSGAAIDVPLRYLAAAAAAFATATAGAVWLAPALAGHYYQPRVVALTHVLTLGWILLAILGASYQIGPIALGRPIWSERLARVQFWVLLVAIAGMVAHFELVTWPGLVLAAGLLALGVALHLINAWRSFRGADRGSATARLIALSYMGLACTVLLGWSLGVNHLWRFLPDHFFPLLHAHVHLAILGFVAPMVFGVAARVFPMFLLASEPARWPTRVQLWGLALGTPAAVVGLLLDLAPLVALGALAAAGAALAHCYWLADLTRHRRRSQLDRGQRLVLAGAAFLVPSTMLGLGFAFDLISGPRPALPYAVLLLGGWISLTIAGMMLKIVPFLVWLRAYGPLVGRASVPSVSELSWIGAERLASALLPTGVIGLAIAVAAGGPEAIRFAAAGLALGALSLAAALARVLWHLRRPVTTGGHAAPRPLGVHLIEERQP